jgi:hypothetical protein
MFPDHSGEHPEIGSRFGRLGVRATDVPVDAQNNVHPGTGGMSVSRSLRELRPDIIPTRLRKDLGLSDARGGDRLRVWRLGTGDFAAAPVSAELALRPDRLGASHGNVEPGRSMPKDTYETALAATRDAWEIDEQ